MMKFICMYGDLKIEVTTEKVYLPHIVEDFKLFLLAAGFQPNNIKEIFGE